MESATKEDRAHPENDFQNKYNPYISTDDQVYKGGIVAYTCNQKDRASLAMLHNNQALWHLINLGAQDMPAVDNTGGKGVITQWVHGEFIVSFGTICLVDTHQVCVEYF